MIRDSFRRGVARFFAVLLPLSAPVEATSRSEVEFWPTVRLSASGESIGQVWAYADPTDGRHLMTCGYFSYRKLNLKYGYVYSSFDGGATWRRTLLDDSTRWVTEESCTYAGRGRAYFVDGESDTSTGEPRHRWGHLQLFVSTDHGMTWNRAAKRAEGFVDWPFLAAIPGDPYHSSSLVIFGNKATDVFGHWSEKQPVVIEATDSAGVFSDLSSLPSNSIGSFAGSSVVLTSGTALFIAGSRGEVQEGVADMRARLRIFGFSPHDHRLRTLATLRVVDDRFFSVSPQLIQDTGPGGYHNRLYAAWSEVGSHGESQLWLSTSDDDGHTWSSRTIWSPGSLHGESCPNDPITISDIRIAVTRTGTLGILWSYKARELLFTSSNDGGHMFNAGAIVAKHEAGQPSVMEAVPHDEWLHAETLAARERKPLAPFVNPAVLGLSIRMSRPQGIGDFSLAADTNNVFHVFWAEVDEDNDHALQTRAIRVGSAGRGVKPVIDGVAPPGCSEGTAPLPPTTPTPLVPVQVDGTTDVTRSLNVQIERIQYIQETKVVTAEVRLINSGDRVLQAPLSLVGIGIHSDFGQAVPLNTTGTLRGEPFWDVSRAVPAEGLAPKASSKAIELRFRLEQFRSVAIGDGVGMLLRLYQERL